MAKNAYELWYDYVRETDKNAKWDEAVREDFAGVFKMSFDEWFAQPQVRIDLFSETFKKPRAEFPVAMLTTKEDYNEYLLDVLEDEKIDDDVGNFSRIFSDLEHVTDHDERMQRALQLCENEVAEHFEKNNHIALVLNLSYPKETLLEWIRTFISAQQGPAKRGRPAERKSFAKYPFARRPDCSSLEIALAAYKLKKTGIPNWQVGNQLANEFTILRNQRIKNDDNDLDAAQKKKILETAVSRYLKLADAVLDGVTKGIFPAK
ncbi:MAG: hypothetical protein J5X22_11175 [Candidatus Accumulibacter sp.]|uniref:hypothetical protein n=1 Tax=Accumulibacter sp. TaxID=2053492 RepID=UPI001AD42826|nr:hypothetical protein [Accumulibacter sp.]MBN8517774.1 hypothetical protein [Accumulibacter sp.]MBO3711050.1 hypothetical protein [Accumulibacter sp.]